MSEQKQRVLLVDDDPQLREMFTRLFERGGCQVTSAENGAVAWQILQRESQSYDLVVSDNTMPDLTGIELFERMHKHEEMKALPFVMFTGDSDPGLKERVKELGGGFFPKPVFKAVVDQIIASVFQK